MSIPFIHLRLFLEFTAPVRQYFPEALLRGSFGMHLKRTVCINRQAECASCFIHKSCVFGLMFCPGGKTDNLALHNVKTVPNPYSLHVYRRKRTCDLIMELLLLKDTFPYFQHIIYSILTLGAEGIGKDRKTFTLRHIVDLHTNRHIYSHDTAKLDEPGICSFKMESATPGTEQEQGALAVNFLSPLRIQKNNKLLKEITFYDLVKMLLIRFSLLDALYGENSTETDIKTLLDAARSVTLDKCNLHWREQRRYSEHQQTVLSMGGFTGSLNYSGNVKPFRPLLEFGRIFGVGKNTTFGCGRYEYELAAADYCLQGGIRDGHLLSDQ